MNLIIIYIGNIIITMILGILKDKKIKISSKNITTWNYVTLVSLVIVYGFIVGFRSSDVGVDTGAYTRIFTIIGSSESFVAALSNAPLSAPVYVLFCRILYFISPNPQTLSIASGILIYFGLFYFVKKVTNKYSEVAFLWIGLSLFYASMNGSRQFLSIVVALNALYFLSKNLKSIKGWALFVISIGIHSTSLFMLMGILGFVLNKKISNDKLILLVSSMISLGISLLFTLAIRIFTIISPRYLMYTNDSSSYSVYFGNGSGRIIYLYIFLLLILILWSINSYRKNSSDGSDWLFLRNIVPGLVAACVFGIVNSRNELLNRMIWYYLSLFAVFIPAFMSSYKGTFKVLLKWAIYIVIMMYGILSIVENQNGVVPYSFFWSSI